ncbi:MAG: hypothetical protein EX258_10325 [Sphingomonadaceae bacterium]|nr:hypothetical protein [Paracoccaceae bacterium]RZV45598.1 MAG: hypothetical protein EX258_10325 [Sphingomonadaceae bacterium]
MQLMEEMADTMAREVLKRERATKDETLVDTVAEIVGSSSTTLQEAFMTAIRVRRAEARAKDFFAEYDKKHNLQARTG